MKALEAHKDPHKEVHKLTDVHILSKSKILEHMSHGRKIWKYGGTEHLVEWAHAHDSFIIKWLFLLIITSAQVTY